MLLPTRKLALLPAIAACLTLISGGVANAQYGSARYTAPPAVRLSPDLSAPWVLQLRRSPIPGSRARLEIAPAPAQAAYANRRVNGFRFGWTPLQQDRVRRMERPRNIAPTPARVEPNAQAARKSFDPRFEPQIVAYRTDQPVGTVVIDTESRYLYLVMQGGQARRYGVGVGKPGFEWAGTHKITRKAEWPDWRPPRQMIEREAAKGRILPEFVEGGPHNPLGARALYLGSTLYRVHGTNQPWTIGEAVSSGCIRMRNEDVIDLYERVGVGTRVVVS